MGATDTLGIAVLRFDFKRQGEGDRDFKKKFLERVLTEADIH